MGIATILHWDRFNHGHVSFIAWAALYFTTPFIVFIVWLRNRPQDSGQPDSPDAVIPQWVRWAMGAVGVVTLFIGLFLFVSPPVMIAVWPWTLTPLTARVMGAMFALPGIVGLGVASDERWSAARVILQAQVFSILLILLAAARARADFDWAQPASWLFVGGLGALLAGIVALSLIMQARLTSTEQ